MPEETTKHMVSECEALEHVRIEQEARLLSGEGETIDIVRSILSLVEALEMAVLQFLR